MRRRGSIYIITILTSGLVAVLAACALSLGQKQAQRAGLFVDVLTIDSTNESAVAVAQQWMMSDPDWRTNYPVVKPAGLAAFTGFTSALPMGRGNVTLTATDPLDGSLAAFRYDPVALTIRTRIGQADHRTQLTLTPQITALTALSYVLYCGGDMRVRDDAAMFANGRGIRSAGVLRVDGVLHGDAQMASLEGGPVHGTAVTTSGSLPLPTTAAIDRLAAQATVLTVTDLKKGVLGPGVNSFGGPTNPYGLYVVNTGGANFDIQQLRVLGTLIIRAGTGMVTLDTSVVFDRPTQNLPALIVEGNCMMKTTDSTLAESVVGISLNPTGAAYGGVADTDKVDIYPTGINGVVYVSGSLSLINPMTIRGALIVGGSVDLDNAPLEITSDDTLTTAPPVGFADITGYAVKRGTWQRLAAP